MVAVTATALTGSIEKARSGLVDFRAGILVALSGIAGAPLGAWLTRFLSPRLLLALFAIVAAVIAVTMLTRMDRPEVSIARTPCPWVMIFLGFGVGMIAGLLGVGGGFMMVPMLVLFGAMEMHRSVATAMPVVALIGMAAVAGHFLAGQRVPVAVTLLFAAGGVLELQLGSRLAKRLPVRWTQRVFAMLVLLMAILMILENIATP